jgi:hypothetical protein
MPDIYEVQQGVNVLGTVIPAINTQVNGYPMTENDIYWPIYFEIMYESGKLWVVEKGEGAVTVSVYSNFHADKDAQADLRFNTNNWELFLDFYKLSVEEE